MSLAGGPKIDDKKITHEIKFTKWIDHDNDPATPDVLQERSTTAKLPELLFKELQALQESE